MMQTSRREFLARSALAVPVLVGSSLFLNAAEKREFPGLIRRNSEPLNLEFPMAALENPVLPNEHFYVRNHFPMPTIDLKTWRLKVEGEVDRPLELTYEDLLKFPVSEQQATLECAGNSRVYLTPTANGVQWSHGAVGNAVWAGVPLAAILEKAGVRGGGVEVILEGADRGPVNSDPKSPGPISFARSIPMAKALKPEVLLAYRMNDKDLPEAHGYPLRAVVAGWYGMSSVKWLTRIVVAAKPFRGFWQSLEYSYWERKDGLPTLVPLTAMQPKAVIARPTPNEIIAARKPQLIFGAAWAGEAAVAKVEVATDGGIIWHEAKLLKKPQPFTWCLWEWNWRAPAEAGVISIMARAVDTAGKTQPIRRDVDRRNYMINHIVPVSVTVQ